MLLCFLYAPNIKAVKCYSCKEKGIGQNHQKLPSQNIVSLFQPITEIENILNTGGRKKKNARSKAVQPPCF